MSDRFELFLTCPKGLEGLLIEEAVGLGLEEAREHTSAVRGMADMETAYRLCLWSRLANRVLLVLKRFPMKDAKISTTACWTSTGPTTWSPTGALAVEFSGHGSGIDNAHFGALRRSRMRSSTNCALPVRRAPRPIDEDQPGLCVFTCAWTVAKRSCPRSLRS